ncbi:MAG: phage tail protein [Rickettsiales bacterium]|jgi:predicted secreted protein|nr:phage tail protein [Rickettsiales bacterium]
MIYSGSLVLLSLKQADQWQAVGGMRNLKMVVNSQLIDSSNNNSIAWRELLNEAGLRYVSISGSGAFTDSAGEIYLQELVFTGKLAKYKFKFANGSSLIGKFIISHYERLGEVNEEENYVINLESSGEVLFEKKR